MNTGAERLVNGARGLGFVDEIAAKFFARNHARRIAEGFVEKFRFGGDLFKAALPMGRYREMPAAR